MMKTVIIAGPTATGKTDLAIKLASDHKGVIINADSRQVYMGMDIGTNKGIIKPNGLDVHLKDRIVKGYELEGSGVSGYLFDFLRPDQAMDLFTFQGLTYKLLEYFNSKNIPVFLTGGTGLYLDAIIKGYDLTRTPKDDKLRGELMLLDTAHLQSRLSELNPKAYLDLNNSDRNNPRRLIRLIEKALSPTPNLRLGRKLSSLILYPVFNRLELYKKIDIRVDLMFQQGLIAEVINLTNNGFKEAIALQGMGYSQVIDHLEGKLALVDCAKLIKIAHRNYAKRQITWFEAPGRNYDLKRYDFKADYRKIKDLVTNYLNK